jgi:carbamoyl-phosphate synthase small subunit
MREMPVSMSKDAFLVLADGTVYQGLSFGYDTDVFGEVVFNTSMAGYQEILTDPSYAGQIVIPTFPLIGNYGINDIDAESGRIQVRGFVVREECKEPNHYLDKHTLHQYLRDHHIPGICGIDTRAVTRKLRASGVMMGYLTTQSSPEKALEQLKKVPDYGSTDFVHEVSCRENFVWPGKVREPEFNLVVLDCGTKYNIFRLLSERGCCITAVPCGTSSAEILALNPDGILLSPGPGDPRLLPQIVKTVKELAGKKPVMGICLGCQLIGMAFNGGIFKLKFGHRGGNHPVRELATGRVHITAQNHGYAVDPDSLRDGLEVSHINLNDDTVEGLQHRELPIISIQYHSEASPGPLDSVYLFDRFIDLMRKEKNNHHR